jgi:hypothetical protein
MKKESKIVNKSFKSIELKLLKKSIVIFQNKNLTIKIV